MEHRESSIVRFYRVIRSARDPQPADPSALGMLSIRTICYHEPARLASGFGWYVYPPTDFKVLWDGHDIYWRTPNARRWTRLVPGVQFPGKDHRFDEGVSEDTPGCAPAFLNVLPEAGHLQIWTGIIAATRAGWSLLGRSPANVSLPGGYICYDGIVEADRWFGPLIANVRLTQVSSPICFRANFPLLQLQPLPQVAYGDHIAASMELHNQLEPDELRQYRDTIAPLSGNLGPQHNIYASLGNKQRSP